MAETHYNEQRVSERLEQFTDRSNGGYERLLYVHEDLQGNTRYYTKENGNSFAELTYDAWGMPVSPNKLLNNDHGNYVYATYTGHIFDTTLDIYFCEARFYDANTRQWMAMDPVKDGENWYQYCYSNPLTYWDPTGTSGFKIFGCEVSDGGIKVDKVQLVFEAVKTVLPRMLQELYSNKTLSSEQELLSKLNGVPSSVLKFAGDALIGIGNGFKLWSPYITSLGLALTLFGAGPGAGMAIALPGIGTAADASALAAGAALTGLGVSSELLGRVLTFAGQGMSDMGNREEPERKDSEGESEEGNGTARGKLTGKLDGLTADERKVVNDLLDAGNDVEIIPRSDTTKMPDYYVNGVKTELKTLNGNSLNTPITRIQDGFKQGAETVIIDARKTGITTEQAVSIIDRATGVYGGELPGTVEIWTIGGKIIR